MLKHVLVVSVLVLCISLPALASSDREDDVTRIDKATQVFKDIMSTPDKGIPNELLESAKCIAIIPGDTKFAFVFGGSYGRGLVTCRTEHGWSAPMFLAVDGGSVGYQIGGSSTDLVMLFMNDHALKSLLSDKFKLGADASVAAGPVGRNAAAATDLKIKTPRSCPILALKASSLGSAWAVQSCRRTRVEIRAQYGAHVDRHEILSGKVSVPPFG